MSPRSGTPVKLLGREDASVDWYNLEKSKRVKAFRCGEFDACIERAEATQGTLAKKREKYARREDAILHALELERKQLASKHQTQGLRPTYFSACTKHRKDLGSTRYKSKKRKRKDVSAPPDIKKEAEQYFLHTGPKRNFSESLAQGTSENLISNHLGDLSNVRHIQGRASLGSKERSTVVKKNRSDGSDFDESIERCDRRRLLVQVMQQSSAKLPHHSPHNDDYGSILIGGDKDPSPATYRAKRSKFAYLPSDSGETHSHSDLLSAQMASKGADSETESYLQHPDSSSEEHTSSDLVEKHISESSERECSESETEDDAELLQSANMIMPSELRTRDSYFLPVPDKFGHVDNIDDEMIYSSYMHHESEEEDGSSELGVSQWHIKGKRNNRNGVRRSMHMTAGNSLFDKSNGSTKGSVYKTNGINHRKERVQTSNQPLLSQSFDQIKGEVNYDSDETDLFENTSHREVNLYHSRTYPSSLKATRDLSRSYIYFNDCENDSSKISPLHWDADRVFRADQSACWDRSSFYQRNCSSRLGGMGPVLLDVDLKVQASYHGEHVPLVSLMSRLDGKAIVGHPIQIEILEDSSTDHLVSGGDVSLEESSGAPPAWRTGRRTAMQRIPRCNPSVASLGGEDEGSVAYPDWEMKPVFRKYSTSNHQAKVDKKSKSNSRRSSASKSHKTANLSSQKVRTLSSISTERRHNGGCSQAKAHKHIDIFSGLIKPDGAIPLVTCVPAKIVFTRILEAVGRPPLTVIHRAGMASLAVRDPS